MELNIRKKTSILLSLIYIAIIAILGGRMAAVACSIMIVIAYLFSRNIPVIKKTIFIATAVIIGIYLLDHLYDFLTDLSLVLSKYGLHSRSVILLLDQLRTKELFITNRDVIYDITTSFIKTNWMLPNGFGIALYLTNGQYYYVHNLILQLFVVFGVPGAFAYAILFLHRYLKLHLITDKRLINLIGFMILPYAIIGFTGSSMFIHYLSTIPIAVLFFGSHSDLSIDGK